MLARHGARVTIFDASHPREKPCGGGVTARALALVADAFDPAQCPASVIRTSNQVGRPWMFDGKMLRAATGTPIRRIDLANIPLALAEPEPFTLANLTTKSLVTTAGDFAAAGSTETDMPPPHGSFPG